MGQCVGICVSWVLVQLSILTLVSRTHVRKDRNLFRYPVTCPYMNAMLYCLSGNAITSLEVPFHPSIHHPSRLPQKPPRLSLPKHAPDAPQQCSTRLAYRPETETCRKIRKSSETWVCRSGDLGEVRTDDQHDAQFVGKGGWGVVAEGEGCQYEG